MPASRSDEILAVRRLSGDNPEVLRSIGLEIAEKS
jgi:hypothetical protein